MRSTPSPAPAKYLARYAEPEIAIANDIPGRFGHVLTIPAYAEGDALLDTLASVPEGTLGPVLVVVAINGRADSPREARAANLAMLERLPAEFGPDAPIGPAARLMDHPRGALLAIDRATAGRELPARHGVGTARKIAADLALALWSRGAIASPWIHCTDADVRLPADYFAAAPKREENTAALLYPFRHDDASDADRHRDALEYEISLRYYVAGLRSARSPYAFHTIGSTIAAHVVSYAAVRGFPRRLAAEDFYLLNKLAKVGGVRTLDGEPLRLSARSSDRTPFGTGRALARARRRDRTREPTRLYHPAVFDYLGVWERALDALATRGTARALSDLLADCARERPGIDPELLRAGLEEIGAWKSARAAADRGLRREVLAKQLCDGFDAARTLKLIHALRAHGLHSLPLAEALCRAPFVRWERAAGLEAAREQLAALEKPPSPEPISRAESHPQLAPIF